jgi:hypothetical protein
MNTEQRTFVILAVMVILFLSLYGMRLYSNGKMCKDTYGKEYYYSNEQADLCISAITNEKKIFNP